MANQSADQTAKQTALITGASGGLGLEYAKLFAKDGHDVVVVARRRDKLDELAKELSGVKATVVPADLTDPAAPQKIFDAVTKAGVTVDFVVNNAGFGSTGPFADADAKRELEMVEVNVKALMHL